MRNATGVVPCVYVSVARTRTRFELTDKGTWRNCTPELDARMFTLFSQVTQFDPLSTVYSMSTVTVAPMSTVPAEPNTGRSVGASMTEYWMVLSDHARFRMRSEAVLLAQLNHSCRPFPATAKTMCANVSIPEASSAWP